MNLYDLLWANHGVGNFTASAVLAVAGIVWAERRIVRHLRSLHRKHDELHQKVDSLRKGDE